MAALNILLLQDTQYLLSAYNTRPTFRKMFDDLVKKKTRVVFRSRPLKTYVFAMLAISPKYERYRNQIKADQSKISELFKEYYLDPKSGIKLIEQSINNSNIPTISDRDHSEINTIEKLSPNEKPLAYEKFLAVRERKESQSGSSRPQIPKQVIEKTLKQEPPAETNLPRPEFKVPTSLKNLSSQGQILAKRGGINAVRGIGGMFKEVGGNFLGGGAKFGTGALQLGGRGLVTAGAAIGGSAGAPIIVAVLVVIGVLILGPILMNLLESESFLPPFKQNVSTAEAAGITDTNSCQFYRGGDPTPAQNYKSNLLLQYFQRAEQLTSVPSALLAAVARIESPSIMSKTDADIPALGADKCPISSTIALGIMQVEPPWGTAGYYSDGVAKGASFLNKTVDQLTQSDFCDPQSNILLAAGFILKKLQANNIGDGDKWDPRWTTDQTVINTVAASYYGCLEYGTTEKTASGTTKCAGPYNYGTDLWNSLQSCQVNSITADNLGCPTIGIITNPYGYNIPGQPIDITYQGCDKNITPACHTAIDVGANIGTDVHSTFDGVVTELSYDPNKGNYITISNSQTGYAATYEHLDTQTVVDGQNIKRGDKIGTVGATGAAAGPHLHYRLEKNGQLLNPFRYLGTSAADFNGNVLAQSDNLIDNNYSSIKIPSLNWGRCLISP